VRWGRKQPLIEDNDQLLAQRAAHGDQAAFAVLVSRHERGLRAFLARAGARDLAEDLAQEAFLRAWDRSRSFSGSGSYAGWLYRIGWNLLLDRARQDRRRQRREADDGAGPFHADPQGPAMVEADRLLALLDPRSRAALVLCDGHGWSHSEAAAMLGLPLGTLKSLIARAKDHLRAHIAQGDTV
jgi:RNA polymerase sigma-70 factor (ECF subfamily)